MKNLISSICFAGVVLLLTPHLSHAQNCVMYKPAFGGLLTPISFGTNPGFILPAHCRIKDGGGAFVSIAERRYFQSTQANHYLSRVYFDYEGKNYSVNVDSVSIETFQQNMSNGGTMLAAALPGGTTFDISKAIITGFDYGNSTFDDLKPGRSNVVAPDTQPLSCVFDDNSKKPQPFVTSCGAQVHSRVVSCRDGGRHIGPVAVLCESSRALKDSDATDCFASKKVADLATGSKQGAAK